MTGRLNRTRGARLDDGELRMLKAKVRVIVGGRVFERTVLQLLVDARVNGELTLYAGALPALVELIPAPL